MADEGFHQLELENIALNIAMAGAQATTRSKPAHVKCLWQQINRNRDEKKRSENNRFLRGAERQRAIYLHTKYADLKTRDTKRRRKCNFASPLREANQRWGVHMRDKCGGVAATCDTMSYLRRPAKTRFKKLQVRASAILRAQRNAPKPDTPMDITEAIAASWKERERPTSILDTG